MALGVGLSGRATAGEVAETVRAVLAEAGWRFEDVDVIGTRSRFAGDRRLAALGKPVVGFGDLQLCEGGAPAPPGRDGRAALPVAERAALLAAGARSRLVVAKRKGRHVTVAAAACPP
ncbi:MAG TPA: cobalamin biosynthesis protein [Acidimicrobiales bacterium]|nr:cobalamin biosynthesis protein [Acidimicrobiales bacterium]